MLGIEFRYGLVPQEDRFYASLGTALLAATMGIILALIDSKKATKEWLMPFMTVTHLLLTA